MLESDYQAKIEREGRPTARKCQNCRGSWPRADLAPEPTRQHEGLRCPAGPARATGLPPGVAQSL